MSVFYNAERKCIPKKMRTYGYMHKDNHNAGIRELESANEFEMSDGERDAYGLRADL